jgi:uncharacterized membrane protein YccC
MLQLGARLLPDDAIYADHLTRSGRRLVARVSVGGVGFVGFAVAIALLSSSSWIDVLAGALLAWSVSLLVWAASSYRQNREATEAELLRVAELDLLHHRLNTAAVKLDIPELDLNWEIEAVLTARMERLAHFAGLDEFRPKPSAEGYEFWAKTGNGDSEPA